MDIAVMGAGGVGGYFGGLLARAGHNVTFIARGAHLDAMRRNGLRVISANDGDFTVPGKATANPADVGNQELILFTVKMYHNDDAIHAIAPMVGPNSIVLTLQNGIDNGDRLADVYGAERVMIGSAYLEGRISEPGVVTQGGPGAASFGERTPGITERGRATAGGVPGSQLAGGAAGKHDRDAVEEIRVPVRFRRGLRGQRLHLRGVAHRARNTRCD